MQGHAGVVMEEHRGEKAIRVSVAVIEGAQGPIALLPSAEEVTCPELPFLEASLEAERKAAKREVRFQAPCWAD